MDWLVYVLPQQCLIRLCEQAKARNGMIGGLEDGNQVIQISKKVVVKCGYGVTPGEAATQKYACQRLSRHVVRVPQVYRYFQDHSDPTWPLGFLFMEHIPGLTLADLNLSGADDICERLANIVSELRAVTGSGTPGPIDGGMFQGYLWGDNGTREILRSAEDMNRWLNKRLQLINKTIDLRPYPLVFCHLDLCRRNIKLMEDSSAAAAQCVNDDATYRKSLLQAIAKITRTTDTETECVDLLLRARAASLRYIFEPLEGTGMPADINSWPPPPPLNS
ncbi:hypothetical protein AJ79_06137 [Helicocarpus griseus UAMH5409]|uniref:Aminoglycoside phosphotransferase domain-containing protein n=1 Tax=Helicocarpus griseus UAMH5409 TaxID=1447875 RepID=A0A2B7XG98_9EURO|nr:hypothetical protein AJ79_06137 [Helicocarpus griseus UAMH5409]